MAVNGGAGGCASASRASEGPIGGREILHGPAIPTGCREPVLRLEARGCFSRTGFHAENGGWPVCVQLLHQAVARVLAQAHGASVRREREDDALAQVVAQPEDFAVEVTAGRSRGRLVWRENGTAAGVAGRGFYRISTVRRKWRHGPPDTDEVGHATVALASWSREVEAGAGI